MLVGLDVTLPHPLGELQVKLTVGDSVGDTNDEAFLRDGVMSVALLEGPETVVAHLARRNLIGREHRAHRVTLEVEQVVRQAVLVRGSENR